jgi:hypothetical protein
MKTLVPRSPEYLVEYDCPDLASRVAGMVGLDEVQMNALRLAVAVSGMSQAEFIRDILLAGAEALIGEMGAVGFSLRDN